MNMNTTQTFSTEATPHEDETFSPTSTADNYNMQRAWGILGALVGSGYIDFDLSQPDETFHLAAVLATIERGIQFSE